MRLKAKVVTRKWPPGHQSLLLHMGRCVERFHLHAQPIHSIAKEMAELSAIDSRIRKITIIEIATGQQSRAFHITELPAERITTEPCDVGFARAHTFVFNYRLAFLLGVGVIPKMAAASDGRSCTCWRHDGVSLPLLSS